MVERHGNSSPPSARPRRRGKTSTVSPRTPLDHFILSRKAMTTAPSAQWQPMQARGRARRPPSPSSSFRGRLIAPTEDWEGPAQPPLSTAPNTSPSSRRSVPTSPLENVWWCTRTLPHLPTHLIDTVCAECAGHSTSKLIGKVSVHIHSHGHVALTPSSQTLTSARNVADTTTASVQRDRDKPLPLILYHR